MTSRTVRVRARKPGGGLETRSHTFWYSHFGPIVNVPAAGYAWDSSTAYALGDVNADNMRLVNVWFDIDRARSVDDLVRAQSRNQGVPWVNTIAADSRGQALYQDNSVVPAVSRQKIDTCIPAGLPQIVYQAAGVVTLDGSRPECGWAQASAGAVQPGILAPQPPARSSSAATTSRTPTTRTGTRTRNGRSPASRRSSAARAPSSGLRTRYGLRTIADRLAGKDGLPGRKYTLGRPADAVGARRQRGRPAARRPARRAVRGEPERDRRWAAGRRARRLPGAPQLGHDGAAGQQGRLAVRRLVAAVRRGVLGPLRSAAAADHAEPAGHQRGQHRGDRRGGEEPARPRPAARRDDAPGAVRAPARPQGAAPRLLERLLRRHRGRRRSQGCERRPRRAGALRPGGRGIEHRHAGRADQARPEGHDDHDLLAVREPALAPLGRPDQAVLGRQVDPDHVHAAQIARDAKLRRYTVRGRG